MAADFCFIANTTQGNTHELAPQRAGNRLAQASLANARGADKAKHRPFHVFLERTHRQELHDAFLYLLQVIMVFIQDFFSPDHIQAVNGGLGPGHAGQII